MGRLRDNADPMFFVMRFFLELSPAVCSKMQPQATFLSRCLPGLRGLRRSGGPWGAAGGREEGPGAMTRMTGMTRVTLLTLLPSSFHEAELVPTRVCR